MKARHLLLVTSLAWFSGCGDSTAPVAGISGTVALTFTGGGGGTFNITGVMPTAQANIGNSNWAAGYIDTPTSQTYLMGARARGAGRYDEVFIGIGRLTVGSSPVEVDCDPDSDPCSGLILTINASQADDIFDFICILDTGTMAITEITSSRVEGTFSGSGECISSGLAVSAFTVTNGTFDVPLITQLPQ